MEANTVNILKKKNFTQSYCDFLSSKAKRKWKREKNRERRKMLKWTQNQYHIQYKWKWKLQYHIPKNETKHFIWFPLIYNLIFIGKYLYLFAIWLLYILIVAIVHVEGEQYEIRWLKMELHFLIFCRLSSMETCHSRPNCSTEQTHFFLSSNNHIFISSVTIIFLIEIFKNVE